MSLQLSDYRSCLPDQPVRQAVSVKLTICCLCVKLATCRGLCLKLPTCPSICLWGPASYLLFYLSSPSAAPVTQTHVAESVRIRANGPESAHFKHFLSPSAALVTQSEHLPLLLFANRFFSCLLFSSPSALIACSRQLACTSES